MHIFIKLYSLNCITLIVFIKYNSGGGRLFVDYIDIVDICQCAAACVIMMPCPHHGNVYTVPAHTVCTQTHFIFKYYIINIRGGGSISVINLMT